MKADKKFKIIARTEPHEIIDYYFEQLEEAMSHYDLEEDIDLAQSWLALRTSILYWKQAWEED